SVATDFKSGVAGDLDVFTDLTHGRLAVGFQIHVGISCNLAGHFVAERFETFVARHEVGFAVHFHQHTGFATGSDVLCDNAFTRLAQRLFRRAGSAGFAEIIHRFIHVTLRFDERLLTFHHARAGHLAEFRDVGSSNFSHKNVSLIVESYWLLLSNPDSDYARRCSSAAPPHVRNQAAGAAEAAGAASALTGAASVAGCSSVCLRRLVFDSYSAIALVIVWPI